MKQQLAEACQAAGARDPFYVANCIHLRAARLGIDEALQTAKTNRPDWFHRWALVESANGTGEDRGESREHFRGRRKRAARYSRAAREEV
jgi:hypothetical protein